MHMEVVVADPFWDDMVALGHSVPTAGQRIPSILRLLGRVRYMTSHWIYAMVFPDQHRTTMQRNMERLVANKWVWRENISADILHEAALHRRRGKAVPPPRQPYLYGLTVRGHEAMQTMGLEPEPSMYNLLYRRDPAKPLSRDKVPHDLLTSVWCCSVLHAARQHPWLDAVTCYVEYVTDPGQRIDALMVLRFDPTRALKQTMPGWWFPWYEGDPHHADHITVRFALEVDRGTEPLKTLLEKGLTYRTLTAAGMYDRLLGGSVLPVVLVPPGRRAKQIAREWSHAWPDGSGVISSPRSATHAQFGALWGNYFTMCTNPAVAQPLLSFCSVEDWGSAVSQWIPGMPPR